MRQECELDQDDDEEDDIDDDEVDYDGWIVMKKQTRMAINNEK
jgi:hypothetical protein